MPAPVTVILCDRLIDGCGAEPLERAAVIVQAGRITFVGRRVDLAPTHRAGAEILDLEGATLLPGLIDSHVHLTFNAAPTHAEVRAELETALDGWLAVRAVANAQRHLASGVTTVRDVGGRGFLTLGIRDAINAGIVAGPRVQAAGPAITTTGGHLHYLGTVADSAAEVRAVAAEILGQNADLLKICATGGIMTAESNPTGPQYDTDALRAAVEEADRRGRIVAVHVLGLEALRRCVHAGVRSIEHCTFQTEPGAYDFEPEVAEQMRRQGLVAGLTFAGLGRARYREQALEHTDVPDLGPWRGRMEARYEVERELIASGVRYVLHSDAGVRDTPFGDFWLTPASACFELGISPLEAIRAVTSGPAALLGLGGEIGTLAPGYRADLLAVDGDPSERIEALSQVRAVFQDGGRVV